MDNLPFSTNWNHKLGCPYFTTIRLHNPNKYRIGAVLRVLHKEQFCKYVEVLQVITTTPCKLTELVCRLDTGYSKAETLAILRKMYKNFDTENTKIDLILLKTTEVK